MHQASRKLFERQMRSSMRADGRIDLDKLKSLIIQSYDELSEQVPLAAARQVQPRPVQQIAQAPQTKPNETQLDEKLARSIDFYKQKIARQNTHMSAIVNKLPCGVGLFDADGNLVAANHDFVAIYGLSAEFLEPGINIDDINAARRRNGFTPSDTKQNVYDNWRSYMPGTRAIKTPVAMSNGKVIQVGIDPLAEGGWLSTHEDITSSEVELSLAQSRLDEINRKNIVFDRAINSMFHSVAMFDDNDRLMLCNRAFVNMYELPDELARPGVTLKQIMDYRRAMGSLPVHEAGNLQTVLDYVSSDLDETRVLPLEDGRIMRMARHLLHGAGYIVLHEDITEQTQRIQALKRTNANIKAQQGQFEVAINSILHGMAVFDGDYKLVTSNDAYRKMYNFPEELYQEGADYWEMLRHVNAQGMGIRGDYETSRKEMERKLSTGKVEREQFETKTGRHIMSTVHPLEGGGWISVFEDVSEQVQEAHLREQQTQELADKSRKFLPALDAMAHAMYIFDKDHRLVMCNRAYQDLFKLPNELVQPGTSIFDIFDYRAEFNKAVVHMDAEERRKRIEEGFDTLGEKVRTTRLVNGMVVRVARQRMPDGSWIGVEEDVTEAEKRSELLAQRTSELESQNARFDAALNNMSLGLAVFDKELNLVVCNERYIDLYQLPKNLCVAGASYVDMLKHRVGSGLASSNDFEQLRIEEFSMLREGQNNSGIVHLMNGKIVDVSNQLMADGGWFSTHEDVTERETRAKLLAERSEQLRVQNTRFDAALNNMSQGLAVFDADKKLVVCNDKYAALYRLPDELCEPGADYHDIISYRSRIGLTSHSDVEKLVREVMDEVSRAACSKKSVVMMNGTVMMVLNQPMPEGGWLTTHEDITEQHESERMIRHLARHDGLTGLANRTTFMEAAAEAEVKIAHGEHAALLYIDLNEFKPINDGLGHAAGDGVLKEVAKRLETSVGGLGLCARLGGDEFAILIGPLPHMIDIEQKVQHILSAIDQPISLESAETSVTASLGVALAPEDGTEAEDLMRKADLALYAAKQELGRSFSFFESSMDETHRRRRAIETGLKEAIAKNEMQMFYQPLVSVGENQVTCCEALMRWTSEELGSVSPAEFIPIAEETGRIRELGQWALEKACNAAADWPTHIRVAVNVSPVQFKGGDLYTKVTNALKRSGLEARRLELEITESLLLDDDERNLEVLHKLKSLGVRIALDDFGTGYSSLSYLRHFPFDKIKIDRSFVSDAETESDKSAIVRAIAQLADSMSMSTTAEGVETETQLSMVKEQGCNEVQGYLFSPPLPEKAIGELVRRPLGEEEPQENATQQASSQDTA